MSKIVCPKCGNDVDNVDRGEKREPVVRFITDAGGTVLTAKHVPAREYTFLPCEHTVSGIQNVDDGTSLMVSDK